MYTVLGDLVFKGVIIYIDDILIYSKTFEEHIRLTEQVLERLKRYGLTLSKKKCKWFRKKIEFLGHILEADGCRPNPDKVAAIVAYPAPINRTQLRRFLGSLNFYHRFIQHMASKAIPLFELLSMKVDYVWTSRHQESFDALKTALTTVPVLKAPDWDLPFRLYVDASKRGIGGMLGQSDRDDPHQVHVIEYASYKLTPAETRYAPTYLEARAVVWCVKHWRHYLIGHRCYVYTDHQALISLFTNKLAEQAQLARWQTTLMEYDLVFIYRDGRAQAHVDALSRIFDPNEDDEVTTKTDPEATELMLSLPLVGGGNPFTVVMSVDGEAIGPLDIISMEELDETNPLQPDLEQVEEAEEEQLEELEDAPTALTVTLRAAQLSDPLLRRLVNFIKKGRIPTDKTQESQVRDLANVCQVDDTGMVVYRPTKTYPKERMFVPKSIRHVIMRYHHGDGLTGHFREGRTRARIAERYWWPSAAHDVATFVETCLQCQQENRRAVLPGENAIPPANIRVGPLFHRMSVDVMGPLPVTSTGKRYVVVFMEYLSRWPEAFAVEKADAATIARLITREIVPRFGAPQVLLSDRGSIFLSQLITTLTSTIGTYQDSTTPYHPQANGLVERMNGTIGRLLRRVLATRANHETWDEFIPMILFAIRTTPNSTTKLTPYELMYGRLPLLNLDVALDPERVNKDTKPVDKWLKDVEILRELTMESFREVEDDREQRLRMTTWYVPSINDAVWLYQPLTLTSTSKSSSRKLHNPWTGPWVVISVDNMRNNVELRDPSNARRRRTVHLSRIKRVRGGRPAATELPADMRTYQLEGEEADDAMLEEEQASAPASVNGVEGNNVGTAEVEQEPVVAEVLDQGPGPVDGTDDVYVVEDIVDHKPVNGWYRFKVKWAGYPLEDDDYLHPARLRTPGVKELLDAYRRKHGLTNLKVPRSSRRHVA